LDFLLLLPQGRWETIDVHFVAGQEKATI